MSSSYHEPEQSERRFQFGKNWKRFLSSLDDHQIVEAENSIKWMLEAEDLSGKTFLDIGSGSGLSSLAARRLGASGHIVGIDPSAQQIARARAKAARRSAPIAFQIAVIEQLPFADQTFDVVSRAVPRQSLRPRSK